MKINNSAFPVEKESLSLKSYTLVWYDNGKTLYKIFRCSIIDIQLRFEFKKLMFSNVRVLDGRKTIFGKV